MSQVVSEQGLAGLIEEFMQSSLDFNPMMAAYLGLHQYDGQLPDLRLAAFEKRSENLKALLQRVRALKIQAGDKEAVFDHALLACSISAELRQLPIVLVQT